MPLQSAHVFASHIGHTGKTTLCFQISCLYAKQHPDASVLVVDFAEEGDLTKRLLGGADAAASKRDQVCGGIFKLMSDADSRSRGFLSLVRSSDMDIMQHAVRVNDHNTSVPSNLHLVSSGAWPREEQPLARVDRDRIANSIKQSLEKSSVSWKLFCDTDGDRRPSPLTMLAYSLCPQAIVPLHLSKSDLDRTETMLGMLHQLREEGEIRTQVLAVVWNFVKVLKDEPQAHQGRVGELGVEIPFTPTKVSLDIMRACNNRLFQAMQQLPGLFVQSAEDEATFVARSTLVLRQLADNVLKPSEELGMPFSQMMEQLATSGKKSIKFKSGEVDYEAKCDTIQNVDESIKGLAEKLEAMVISR